MNILTLYSLSYARSIFALFLFSILCSCAPIISPFTEEAYSTATSLKAQSLALVAKSDESFSKHQAAVDQLLVDVDAAYEYANGLPQNEVSAQLWDILRERGYRVCLAHDQQEAAERLQGREFKVVLIDMKLPTGDGTAACRRAHRDAA